MTFFIESEQLRQMQAYKPYAKTKDEKRKVKYELLDCIQNSIGDRWFLFKEGTRQTFDMICFLSAELGFFYASDEYLAERHDLTDRTIRNRFKELIELGLVIKVHKRAKRCNGRGKPVYLFVNHPYFSYWVEFLGIDLNDFDDKFRGNFQTENEEISCESKENQVKKMSTNLKPSLKQENKNKAAKELLEKYAHFKINDILKKGVTVKYISSYITKLFKSLENQSLYYANELDKAKRKNRQEQADKWFKEANGIVDEPAPFYNWLEA